MSKLRVIIVFSIVLFSLTYSGCKKKEVPVVYEVFLRKQNSSLPASVSLEYRFGTRKPGDTHSAEINENWTLTQNCPENEKVTLKATGITNVKSLLIRITANGSTQERECVGTACTVYAEADLDEK